MRTVGVKPFTFIFISILIIISSFYMTACSKNDDIPIEESVFAFDTVISQKVVGKNAQKAIEQVNDLIYKSENLLSLYITKSDVDNINKNAGSAPVKVDGITYEILQSAVVLSQKTEGIFDITVAPLSQLWHINNNDKFIPSDIDIKNTLSLVSYENISLKNQTVFLKEEGMKIDLGGIAKGFICDEIKKIYKQNNIKTALVSVGGNILIYNDSEVSKSYDVGIKQPFGEDIIGKITLTNDIVATSGGYERYFIKNDKLYHHIFDLKTGYPADSDIISVSVISSNGIFTDVLSTTIFINGKKNIDEILNCPDFEVIIIDKENKIYISNSIKEKLEITNNRYSFAE